MVDTQAEPEYVEIKSEPIDVYEDDEFENTMVYSSDGEESYTDEKPVRMFFCTVCSSSYISERRLNLHIDRMHSAQSTPHEVMAPGSDNQTKETSVLLVERKRKVLKTSRTKDNSRIDRKKRKRTSRVIQEKKEANLLLCFICNAPFVDRNKYQLHIMRNHPENSVDTLDYPCDLCDLKYTKRESLRIHLVRTHGVQRSRITKLYECKVCQLGYQSLNDYKTHLRTTSHKEYVENAEKNKSTTCDICLKNFLTENKLTIHRVRSHPELVEELPYKCSYCGLSYDKADSLNSHILRKHSYKSEKQYDSTEIGKVYDCHQCGKNYKQIASFRMHLKRTHNTEHDEQDDGVCSVCTLTFANQRQLRIHMLKKHEIGLELFRHCCTLCINRYDNIESLNKHIRSKHMSAPAGYECRKCLQKFAETVWLQEHDKVCVLKCPQCEKTFRQIGALNRHMNKDHGVVEDKFRCEFCYQKGFKTKRAYDNHITSAHGEFIKCKLCDKHFKTRDGLNKHVIKKHINTTAQDTIAHDAQHTDCDIDDRISVKSE